MWNVLNVTTDTLMLGMWVSEREAWDAVRRYRMKYVGKRYPNNRGFYPYSFRVVPK